MTRQRITPDLVRLAADEARGIEQHILDYTAERWAEFQWRYNLSDALLERLMDHPEVCA